MNFMTLVLRPRTAWLAMFWGHIFGLADAILTAIHDNCLPRNKCGIIAR
jgi:hypothetical protein